MVKHSYDGLALSVIVNQIPNINSSEVLKLLDLLT